MNVPKVFTSQIDRDERIMSLVHSMNDAYAVIPGAEDLRRLKSENINTCIDAMLKQTIECGYFIKEYSSSSFGTDPYSICGVFTDYSYDFAGGKAIKAAFLSSTDKKIALFKDKFMQYKQDLQLATSLHTGIAVYRIVDDIQSVSM